LSDKCNGGVEDNFQKCVDQDEKFFNVVVERWEGCSSIPVSFGGYCNTCNKNTNNKYECNCCAGDYTVMGPGHCCPYY
jgi:hypothetical protein